MACRSTSLRKATMARIPTTAHLYQEAVASAFQENSLAVWGILSALIEPKHLVERHTLAQCASRLLFALVHLFGLGQHIRCDFLTNHDDAVHVARNPVAGIHANIA